LNLPYLEPAASSFPLVGLPAASADDSLDTTFLVAAAHALVVVDYVLLLLAHVPLLSLSLLVQLLVLRLLFFLFGVKMLQ